MKNYNLLLSIILASMVLGSCGSSRNNSLKYVKSETAKTTNQIVAEHSIAPVSAISEYQIGALANQIEHKELPIDEAVGKVGGDICCDSTVTSNVQKEDSLRVRKFVNIHLDKQGKRMDDYQDNESLDNTKAEKLVTFSKGSFIPVVGWIFAIITIIRAKFEWSRIVNNPDTFSGKRKVLLARRLAVTATLIGLLITAVIVGAFLILMMLA